MDDSGIIFSVDAMLAMILIVVLIGYSADAMDITGNKLHDYASEQSYQRVIGSTADTLIKSPGNPENWENINHLQMVTPGLGEIENHRMILNTLSMKKILALKNNPELMEKMIPEGVGYNLMIYPVDPSLRSIPIFNKNIPRTAADIYVVNRTVAVDYQKFKIYAAIKMDQFMNTDDKNRFICPNSFLLYNKHKTPDFNTRMDGWICVPFNIGRDDLNSKDLYLITDPQILKDNTATWLINRPDNLSGTNQKFIDRPVKINLKISETLGSDFSAVLILHVHTSGEPAQTFNVYLVGVEPGTSTGELKVEYMNPQPAYFILKAWI